LLQQDDQTTEHVLLEKTRRNACVAPHGVRINHFFHFQQSLISFNLVPMAQKGCAVSEAILNIKQNWSSGGGGGGGGRLIQS
jgi:hypothetical protein